MQGTKFLSYFITVTVTQFAPEVTSKYGRVIEVKNNGTIQITNSEGSYGCLREDGL